MTMQFIICLQDENEEVGLFAPSLHCNIQGLKDFVSLVIKYAIGEELLALF